MIGCEVNALEYYTISTLKTFFNLELNKLLYYTLNIDVQCFEIDFVMIVGALTIILKYHHINLNITFNNNDEFV